MSTLIQAEVFRFVEIRRRLLELHPDLDDQTLADTLDGATNLTEALASLIRSALDDEGLAKALKDRADTMRSRLARLEARATSKRQVAVETMQTANLRKLTEPDFTASVRTGQPGVSIVNEWELPQQYLIPPPSAAQRRAILDALTSGSVVPGAALADPKTSLSVRSQ